MKKLNITWNGVEDTTGYLFSFAKSLSAVIKNSPYAELSEDVIATSGFAFRMWVAEDLCPSATSIWSFASQKEWVENIGLKCGYVERLWGQEEIEEEKRLAAVDLIRESIDNGIAAVSWDISGCEWGVITGYDDGSETFSTLKIDGSENSIGYGDLGKLELPILSVLTITGREEKAQEDIIKGTLSIAASHLKGEEWCDNAKGMGAYPVLIDFIRDKLSEDTAWNLEYYLGTYAALKWYAYKFFDKYGLTELAEKYRTIHGEWQAAFRLKAEKDVTDEGVRSEIVSHLSAAGKAEEQALQIMTK